MSADEPWENNLNPITMLPVHDKVVSKDQRKKWNENRNKKYQSKKSN